MIRSLPPLGVTGASPNMAMMVEHRAPSPLPPVPMGHEISRPSSTSTQASNALVFQQAGVSLPGLSTLAAAAAVPTPQIRQPFNAIAQQHFASTASPTPTSVSGQSNPPVCQNCSTSTTPLWRRDELGSVLCNACGLFLKLHGRPRPISLKTDVIKSRNRVKSSQQQKKKPPYFGHGLPGARSEGGSPPPGFPRLGNNSGSDRSHSPISRTTTPAMLGMPPHHIFDTSAMGDHAYGIPGRSPSLPALHFRQPSPNSAAYMDRHLQPPHPFDPLQMMNTELKTKVSELEVINGLFNDRVRQLENERQQSLQREEEFKRQIAQLQDEVSFLRRQSTGSKRSLEDDDSPFAKRSRISDVSTFSILSNPSQPLTTAAK